MRTLRTLAAVATVTAGVGAALATTSRALVRRQAAVARGVIGKPLGEVAPVADRTWRRKRHPGEPLELLVLGDSIAAGLGAERRKDTLGARVAIRLARRLGRPVRLTVAAVVGAESPDLAGQIALLPFEYRADAAIVVVGGNDVIHRVRPRDSAAHLIRAIERLRRDGTAVVVGTCPDLGVLRAVPQPLRSMLSILSHRLAALQARAAERAGAHPVSLRVAVSPHFRSDPDTMFSVDGFHPSAQGYRRTAAALVPALLDALEAEGSARPGAQPTADASEAATPQRA